MIRYSLHPSDPLAPVQLRRSEWRASLDLLARLGFALEARRTQAANACDFHLLNETTADIGHLTRLIDAVRRDLDRSEAA